MALLYYESTEKSIHQKGKDGIYGVWALPTLHIYRLLSRIWAYFSAFILCLEYGENTPVIMVEMLHLTFLKMYVCTACVSDVQLILT